MKGLDKNTQPSDQKTQDLDMQRLMMQAGFYPPQMDVLSYALPQYAANYSLTAAMQMQHQLNMLTLQQQNMLRA